MMRRHLGYTPNEVDNMKWYELRMWIEKLQEEFSESAGGADDDGFADEPPGKVINTDDLSSLGIVAHQI